MQEVECCGGRVLQITAENDRRTQYRYGGQGRPEGQLSPGLGIDAFRRGEELSYCHRDEQLGTALISGGQGELLNSYQYDAFGAELESVEQLSNRIRYTGQQYDGLTGQYYLRARYYNPVLGRFMQEDTYWGDGLNLYAYCGNNPVIYDELSGYAKFKLFCSKDKVGSGTEENSDGSQKYYQVTSKENAQALIESESPALVGTEFQEIYAWTEQPTYEQASNSGARYLETVIEFETSASFIPDTSMDDKTLWNIARVSARSGPISITNVVEVGFKEIKRWWQFWKK